MTTEPLAGTDPAGVVQKWRGQFPVAELEVLAKAGYGNRLGLGQRPALLVVDATYSFCGVEPRPILEAIELNRRSCGDRAWAALERIQRLLSAARLASIPVVFSTMRDTGDPAYEPGLWGAKNTRGAEDGAQRGDDGRDNEILDEIAPEPGEYIVAKDKPSLFIGTGLTGYLIARGVDSLIVCGGTSSGCVYATAVDGFSRNYRVTVAGDACFDRVDTPHWASLLDIDMKYGDVIDTDEVFRYLQALRQSA